MAGTNKTKPSKALQSRYEAYKSLNTVQRNAARKLARHLKRFPNDEQGAQALKQVASKTHRKAPNKKLGWVTKQPGVGSLAMASSPYLPPGTAKVITNNVRKESAILASKVIKIQGLARRSETPMFDKEGAIVYKHQKIVTPQGKNLSRIISNSANAVIVKAEQRAEREAAQAAADILAKNISAKPKQSNYKGAKPKAKTPATNKA